VARLRVFEAQQRLIESRLSLEAERDALERLFVTAPIAGTVLSIAAPPGAVLDPDAPVVLEIAVPLASAENVLIVPVAALTRAASREEPRTATVRVVSPDGGTSLREIVVGAMDRINAE